MDRLLSTCTRALSWLILTTLLPVVAARAQTFLTVPFNLSETGHAAVPSIATGPAGDINVVWQDSHAILFRRSTDGGQTFSATMTVSAVNLPAQSSQPQIVATGPGVYVAWAGTNSSGGGDIFFSAFVNGTWGAAVNVSGGSGIAGGPAPVPHMTVDPSGGVDLVWGQNGAFFRRFLNGSFLAAVQLTGSAMATVSPRIAINSAGHVFVVWENAAPCPTIMFARSSDEGASFKTYTVADNLTVNSQSITGCTSDVQIAVGASNTIHLLWANENQQIQDLIATYATDSDQAFSGSNFPETAFQNLANTAVEAHTPQIAIDVNGDIDVVWIGDASLSNSSKLVYFSRSTDNGQTFSAVPPLTNLPSANALSTGFPQIAAEGSGSIDIVWQQASTTNPSGAYDVILARSTDGINFAKTTISSSPTTQSGTGQITVDAGGNAYAVWQGSSGSGGDVLLNGDSAGLMAAAQFSISGVKLSASPLSAVINVGGSASFRLSLSSTNAVPGSVMLACGGAPPGVSCSFTPNSVNLAANGSASATLNVGVTVKPSAARLPSPGEELSRWRRGPSPATLYAIGLVLLASLFIAAWRARDGYRFASNFALAVLLLAVAAGLVSCGGSTQSTGGGGGSITFPLTLQGQSNSSSAALQTISITVP